MICITYWGRWGRQGPLVSLLCPTMCVRSTQNNLQDHEELLCSTQGSPMMLKKKNSGRNTTSNR